MSRKSLLTAMMLSILALPAIAAAEMWKDVPLIDHNCVNKVKADPDKHTTSCLLMCAGSGYGVLTSDGTWVKLDKKGNQEALAALKATTKTAGIRVTVEGKRSGDMIKVSSLAID
jgi:hypothetical protein